VAPNTIKFR